MSLTSTALVVALAVQALAGQTPPVAPQDPQTQSAGAPVAPVAPPAAQPDGGLPRRVRSGLAFAETPGGIVIRAIAPRSAAEAAGLKEGDVISTFDASPMTDIQTLMSRIRNVRPGQPVRLGIVRNGEQLDVNLVPEEALREGDLEAKVDYSAVVGAEGRIRTVWAVPAQATGPRPAVLVVRGIVSSPADAPGNNAFRDLSLQLARAGIIAVRYDPAGVGDSEGPNNSSVDFNTEIADARAVLESIKADSRVDPEKIVILGHGTGGAIAALLATADKKVAGIAVVGTIARPLMEYLLESRRQQLTLAGVPPTEAEDVVREHIAVFAKLLVDGATPQPDDLGIVARDGTVLGKDPAYWRQFDRVNFAKIYSELTVPVLNAIGEYDFVSTLADHRYIEDALKSQSPRRQPVVVLDRADHDLRTFDSREAAFTGFGSAEAPVDEPAVAVIVDWIKARLAPPSEPAAGGN